MGKNSGIGKGERVESLHRFARQEDRRKRLFVWQPINGGILAQTPFSRYCRGAIFSG
jgi:hypothetical protein